MSWHGSAVRSLLLTAAGRAPSRHSMWQAASVPSGLIRNVNLPRLLWQDDLGQDTFAFARSKTLFFFHSRSYPWQWFLFTTYLFATWMHSWNRRFIGAGAMSVLSTVPMREFHLSRPLTKWLLNELRHLIEIIKAILCNLKIKDII